MKEETIHFLNNRPFLIEVKSIKRYPIHWHCNVTEIIMPIKGDILVKANFEKILVKEGDFWFVNNQTIHSIESSSNSIVISFYVDLNYFEKDYKYIKYMFFRNNIYVKNNSITESDNLDDDIRKGYKTRFKNLLISVLMDAMDEEPLAEELLKDSIHQLVASMVKEFNWLHFLKKNTDYISKLHLDRYHGIVKYIHEHYQNKITLKDISKREYITENYFSHFWKSLSNYSFKDRLNYERVLKSEFLLLTTNMSILDIAHTCGFSHVKYYYKHFKRWYGCSPLEHKKACFAYMNKDFEYNSLSLSSVQRIIDEYLKTIVLPEYAQNNIWKTTDLFDNFVKMKYLYKLEKFSPQKAPRNVVIDVFSPNNFKIKDGNPFFNWQNIDLLVNFSETSNFDIDLRIRCKYLEKDWFKEALHKFLDLCIYRYRLVTIKKWNFFINYNNEETFKMANIIGDIVANKIKNANIKYFFEI